MTAENELNELRGIAERVGANDHIDVGSIIRDIVDEKWVNPTGAYNIALKERLTALSVSDNWAEAKLEWKATGEVWYVPMRESADDILPAIHQEKHPHECVCGHKIAWHFEIINTENNIREIVGSEHIGFWMVARHLLADLNIPADMITQERVKVWIKESVKTMKAEWWWSRWGEQFEEWFNAVKETDLRVNVRDGESYWDSDTNRYEHQQLVRKKAVSKMGEPDYAMASIVWRWNHPNNSRRQIETRGYPNERLWNDLQMFYILSQRWKDEIAAEDAETARRIEQLAEQERIAEERRERQRIENEERRQRDRERREQRQIEEAELEGVREERRLAAVIADRINAANSNETFKDMCEYYDVPMFTPNIATKDWDKRFLTDMIRQMSSGKQLSPRQLSFLRNIVVDEPLPATDKQIWYIKKLAGDDYVIPDGLNRTDASSLIDQLKRTGGLIE